MFYEGGMVHCVTQQQPIDLNATSIIEINNENRKLINIVDVLGREVKQMSNQIIFYIFDNGSVEKKIQLNE
jgi:hypothetical protein